jgi:PPOX class probable F420-dependent enzyme
MVAARVGRLALLDSDDRPRVLPVTFAVHDGAVWSAIDEKPKRSAHPARVRWLRRRPEAALLVDVYDEDWTKLAWVQLLGTVDVLPAAAHPAAVDALANKYPAYGTRHPPGPLLKLTIERAVHWRALDG